jgi:hypothetical protein
MSSTNYLIFCEKFLFSATGEGWDTQIFSELESDDKACPDRHATALNFSLSHCMSLLNFLGEFLECI